MLIAIEGIDQSGKATLARSIATRADKRGLRPVVLTFPDYGTPTGRLLGAALAGKSECSAEMMQLLCAVNRFEKRELVQGLLDAGSMVICDRYTGSGLAYGEALGVDTDWLDEVERPMPPAGITLLLDIDPQTAAARKPAGRDAYEANAALQARARDAYARRAKRHGWTVLDATEAPAKLGAQAWNAITRQGRTARCDGAATPGGRRPDTWSRDC